MLITTINSKGGVGKSTIAVHLAGHLEKEGRSVAFIDADALNTSSKWLSLAAPKIPVFNLQTAEDIEKRLKDIITQYEYIIADGPAGLSEVTRSLLSFAHKAIFPCGPSPADVWAVMQAIPAINEINNLRNGLPETIFVPNKLQSQIPLTHSLLRIMRELNMPGNGLGFRQAYIQAIVQGTFVWRLKTQGARQATAELQVLFQQLIQNDSPTTSKNDGSSGELARAHS